MSQPLAEALPLLLVVALIMLSTGLGLTADDFRRVAADRKAVALGLGGQLLLLPAFAFAVAALFDLSPPLAVGMVLIAACPGGAHSNLFSSLAHADLALSVTLTAVSGLASVVTLPLMVRAATELFAGHGEVVELPILSTMGQLLAFMVMPVGFGMWIRTRGVERALVLERRVKAFAMFLLVVLVLGLVAKRPMDVAAAAAEVGIPVVVLNVGAMLAAWAITRASRVGVEQSLAIVLEVGIQNATVAFSLAAGIMGSVVVATPGMIYSLLVYLTGAVVVVVGRRHARSAAAPGALRAGEGAS